MLATPCRHSEISKCIKRIKHINQTDIIKTSSVCYCEERLCIVINNFTGWRIHDVSKSKAYTCNREWVKLSSPIALLSLSPCDMDACMQPSMGHIFLSYSIVTPCHMDACILLCMAAHGISASLFIIQYCLRWSSTPGRCEVLYSSPHHHHPQSKNNTSEWWSVTIVCTGTSEWWSVTIVCTGTPNNNVWFTAVTTETQTLITWCYSTTLEQLRTTNTMKSWWHYNNDDRWHLCCCVKHRLYTDNCIEMHILVWRKLVYTNKATDDMHCFPVCGDEVKF